MPPRRALQHVTGRRPKAKAHKDSLTNIIRYCLFVIMLLLACYYVCRMIFLAMYIVMHTGAAYLLHPCEWQKKESWRKRQMKNIQGFYKKMYSRKKDICQIIRGIPGIPFMSLFSWSFIHGDNEREHSVEEETPSNTA